MFPNDYQNYFPSRHMYDASQLGIKLYVYALCSTYQIPATRQTQAKKGSL